MSRNGDVIHGPWLRARVAAEIAQMALERGAAHMALDAAREAARSALLALADRPQRLPAVDRSRLQEMAATSPPALAGQPAEREARIRSVLAILAPSQAGPSLAEGAGPWR